METRFGYKLFEENAKGELFPLFIDKNTSLPIGEWIKAGFHPTKGFAPRGGWHIAANFPDAPWLKNSRGESTPRWKRGRRVWCVVEYNVNHDYDAEVKLLPKKSFTDKVPDDGFYFFAEAGKGIWVISSDMKIVRKIDEDERKRILKDGGYDEDAVFAKYKAAFEKRKITKERKTV